MHLWPEYEKTGDDTRDAIRDFASWLEWIADRVPWIHDISFREQSDLYVLMLEMRTDLPRMTKEEAQ